MSKTPTFKSWREMKERCSNPNNHAFHNYGGRGITVCDRWKNSFENFLADMGKRPEGDYSIDRIENSGNYEPGNCRWATAETQCNNRRGNVRIILNGIEETLANHAKRIGIKYHTFYARWRKGFYQRELI